MRTEKVKHPSKQPAITSSGLFSTSAREEQCDFETDLPPTSSQREPRRFKTKKIISPEDLYSDSIIVEVIRQKKGTLDIKISGRPPSNVTVIQGDHVTAYQGFINQIKKAVRGNSPSAALEGMLLLISVLNDLEKQHQIYDVVIGMTRPYYTSNNTDPDGIIKYNVVEEEVTRALVFLVKAYLTARNKEAGTAYFNLNYVKKEIPRDIFCNLISLNNKIVLDHTVSTRASLVDQMIDMMDNQLDYPVIQVASSTVKASHKVKNRKIKNSSWRDNSVDRFALAISQQITSTLIFCDNFINELNNITEKLTCKVLEKDNSAWLDEFGKQKEYEHFSKEEMRNLVTQKVKNLLPSWLIAESEEIQSDDPSLEEKSSPMEFSSHDSDQEEPASLFFADMKVEVATATALPNLEPNLSTLSTTDIIQEIRRRSERLPKNKRERVHEALDCLHDVFLEEEVQESRSSITV